MERGLEHGNDEWNPRLERCATSRAREVAFKGLAFSSVFSDHMLVARYGNGAWHDVRIQPYGPLPLMPSISALQYAVSVFEGLKAHRTRDGRIVLFRPEQNARRLNRSAARLAMPEVPESLFLRGLESLLREDAAWVPPADVGALYIRPCLFSVDESVRVKPAGAFLFVIFTFPFGAYYARPVNVLVTERFVRACQGGTGDVKPAGNYAPTLAADQEAHDTGFDTVLWLDARERRYVEECGVMNLFVVTGDRILTPPLGGTILPGVTRASVVSLLREMGHTVEERPVAVDELITWHEAGRLTECFGTGTAATVSHVARIHYRGRDLVLPHQDGGPIARAVRDRLVGIMTGEVADTHGWVRQVV